MEWGREDNGEDEDNNFLDEDDKEADRQGMIMEAETSMAAKKSYEETQEDLNDLALLNEEHDENMDTEGMG